MTRILLTATAAALLLSTGLGSAAGLVPGSDQSVREEQAAADWSVVVGPAATRETGEEAYGYPVRAGDRAADERTPGEVPASKAVPTGKIVPGSDSF
jgi:hypothetical protein